MNAALLLDLLGRIAAAGVALWAANAALRALSPGVYARSRYVFVGMALGLSPAFWTAVREMPVLVVATGAALVAIAFFARATEQWRGRHLWAFFGAMGAAIWMYPATAWTLVLPALALVLEWPRWRLAVLAFLLIGGTRWAWAHLGGFTFEISDALGWSLTNFFRPPQPNALVLWQPFGHPFFCLPLPALLFLFKATDIALYSRRVLALSMGVFLLYGAGLPALHPIQLLPVYGLLLLILFPAWDRFFAYGRYFFPRLTAALIGITLACQGIALIFFLR